MSGLGGMCNMIVVLYKGLLVIVGYEWGMWGVKCHNSRAQRSIVE